MIQPIRVFYSPLTCRFFATNKWRTVIPVEKGCEPYVRVTGQKFDVTQDIGEAIERYGIVFEPVEKSRKRKATKS